MTQDPPTPDCEEEPFGDLTPIANLADLSGGAPGENKATRFIKRMTERIAKGKPETPLPKIGDRIGRYEIKEELGRGFAGVVYRAHHRMLGIDVALKILLRTDQDPELLPQSYREANLLAQLNHPNITRVLDFDEHDPWSFLVLEYVDGSDVKTLIDKEGQLDQEVLINIIEQTCEGLKYAQQLGVIHCDIKPANLLLTRDGKVKVADLGMAKISGKGQVTSKYESGANAAGGTPQYISPEMATGGFQDTDHRGDIYSLGVTMFHALAGRPPFQHQNPYELVLMHMREPPPMLSEFREGLDPSLVALVTCMLAKEPAGRPQSYDEIISDLAVIRESIVSDEDSSMQIFFTAQPVEGAPAQASQAGETDPNRSTRFWNWLFRKPRNKG